MSLVRLSLFLMRSAGPAYALFLIRYMLRKRSKYAHAKDRASERTLIREKRENIYGISLHLRLVLTNSHTSASAHLSHREEPGEGSSHIWGTGSSRRILPWIQRKSRRYCLQCRLEISRICTGSTV
jgi:hypothetical protein